VSAQEIHGESPTTRTFTHGTQMPWDVVRRRPVDARAMRWSYLFRLRLACAEAERRCRNWEWELWKDLMLRTMKKERWVGGV
jgi:hypothetical protein